MISLAKSGIARCLGAIAGMASVGTLGIAASPAVARPVGTTFTPIFRSGSTVTGLGQQFSSDSPVISNNGVVTFTGSGGILLNRPADTLSPVTRLGSNTFGIGSYLATNTNDGTIIASRGSSLAAVSAPTGTLRTVVTQGAAAPGFGGGTLANSGFGSSNAGFNSNFGTGVAYFVGVGGASGGSDTGIFASLPNSGGTYNAPVAIARQNDVAPGGGTFGFFGAPVAGGNIVAFGGNFSLYTRRGDASTAGFVVAQNGTPFAGGTIFSPINNTISLSSNGSNLAFLSDYRDSLNNTFRGLFRLTGLGTDGNSVGAQLSLLATNGDAAPGAFGGTLDTGTVVTTSINDAGNIAFRMNVSGGSRPGETLFFAESSGAVSRIVGNGDTIDGGITSGELSLSPNALNNANQLAFKRIGNFSGDFSRDVTVANIVVVPEPGTGWIALLVIPATGVLVTRRRTK